LTGNSLRGPKANILGEGQKTDTKRLVFCFTAKPRKAQSEAV